MSGTTPISVPPRAGEGPAGPRSIAAVRAAVNGVVLWCPDDPPAVTGVVAADLMSDVLVDARPGYVLVTGLVNVQVIRTAAIADLAAGSDMTGHPLHGIPSFYAGAAAAPCAGNA